ncbi:MAG: type 1 glutamine amidotransferase [Litorimonas sp.]
MTRLLMLEGNTLERQVEAREMGIRTASEVYMDAISAHFPDIEMEVLHAANRGQSLPNGRTLDEFDAMVISGSGLHAYDQTFEVQNQIKWLKTFAETGKPILGSCWGLQIAVLAAGGEVSKSPKGQEMGFARKIALTEAGKDHPFMAGKPHVYDAPCIHDDEITELPEGSILLSSNAHSHVQAAIVPVGKSEVWAVQYHPEFNIQTISDLVRLYEDKMYKQGFFKNSEELESYRSMLEALHNDPTNKAHAWQIGLMSDVIDDHTRRAEIINWVNYILKET